MDGTSISGTRSPGAVGTDWTIVGVGDFNADGKADILWRHSSGVVYLWLMDGTSISGTGSAGSADSRWKIPVARAAFWRAEAERSWLANLMAAGET